MIIKVGKNILPKRDKATLTRSVETLCDSVVIMSSLSLAWWKSVAGDFVSVETEQEEEFRGRVASLTELTSEGKVRVFCRDLTADLVDCPHIGTGEFKKVTPLQIMKKITQPFDISVNANIDSGVIDFFGHSLDEKCSDILRRMGQSLGWVITSDGKDGITHWNTAEAEVVLQIEKGKNGNFNLRYDYTQAYSFFKALGQGDFARGQFQLIKQTQGSLDRYRPHVFISETTTDTNRIGREAGRAKNYIEGGRVSALVSYYGGQKLLPGQKISLISDDISEELFIKKVILEKGSRVVTKLEVVLPGRFGVS